MADNNIGQDVLDLLRASPQSDSRINTLPDISPPPPGIEKYAREGIPLDTTTGAGFWSRAGLSFATTPEARQDYMSRAYNGSKVDVTDDGQLIIRNVLDQGSGKAKDLLVDERDFTKGDIADMAAPVLKTAAELLFLRGVGLADAGAMRRVLLGSPVGAAASEAVSATAQALLDQRQTFLEHLKEAGLNAAGGIVLGGALEGGLGMANGLRGRIAGELAPGTSERAGIQALGAVNREAGTAITPSLGQMAGSPDVLNLETFLKRLPFFGTALRKQDELRNEQVRALQKAIVGDEPLQPLANMGADLAETVKAVANQKSQIANTAEQSLATRAAAQLENSITGIAPSARSFTEEGTAAITKLASRSQFGRFNQVADELFSEAGNPEISTKALKPMLEEIESGLPKKTVLSESDLVDTAGRPLATVEGKELVKELIPTELQRFLKGAKSLDETMPLDQLRRIRNTVDSAIREGNSRGLGEVSTYELKRLQHALTETINQGAKDLPDGGAALLRANSFYRENIPKFEVPFVARLLKEGPTDAGYIGNYELMNSIRNNPDRFRELEGFLKSAPTEGGKAIGASSENVFNVVRRSLLEDIASRSRVTPGSSLSRMNADAFVQELERYPSAVRSTLLGADEDVINRNLDLLKQLKSGFKDVPPDKLEAFMRFPANSVEDLSRLATAKKASAQLFENQVVKKLLKGDSTDIDALGSEEALDWLMKAKSNGDVAELMNYASERPELVDSIRRNTAARLFQDVAQKTRPADAARLDDLTQLVDPSKLIDVFRNPETRQRMRLLLGNETFNLMENFAQTQSVLGKVGQGSLSTGATATSILTRTLKFFKNVPLAAKFTIYSTALANRSLQKAILEGSLTPGTDLPSWTAALISSPPVLRALTEQYGQTGTEFVLNAVNAGLRAVHIRGAAPQPPPPRAAPANPGPSNGNIGEDVLQLLRRN